MSSYSNDASDSDDEERANLPQNEIFYPTLEEGELVCEECERNKVQWYCAEKQCMMALCDMCFEVLHRKGKRASHAKVPPSSDKTSSSPFSPSRGGKSNAIPLSPRWMKEKLFGGDNDTYNGSSSQMDEEVDHDIIMKNVPLSSSRSVRERSKWIPIRLQYGQRKYLRMVESALATCDYTSHVDRVFKNPIQRQQVQMKYITSVFKGIVASINFNVAREIHEEQNYHKYQEYLQRYVEFARRHKIMNPEKMRGEYGKLVYLLQDACNPAIYEELGFSLIKPIQTVYKFLESHNGLDLLDDPDIQYATQEILPDKDKPRYQIDREIKRKERAVEKISRKYSRGQLNEERIKQCLYSISDNNSFLNSNRVPIDKMIDLLKEHFSPTIIEDGYSLAISDGIGGARLTHDHERHFNFALQSMTLWREITDDMFRLWMLAESDLINAADCPYELKETGQGLNRVQQCPQTYHAMKELLYTTQKRLGSWIGSSVIHLGDHNVPNALMFIDKYTQVPDILRPIITCLEQIERIYEEDDGIKKMVDKHYNGIQQAKKDILYDFFKGAFDGSGGDNFFDAGSCIDGRLTSAWNWCAQITNKPYYPLFQVTGFKSFDASVF